MASRIPPAAVFDLITLVGDGYDRFLGYSEPSQPPAPIPQGFEGEMYGNLPNFLPAQLLSTIASYAAPTLREWLPLSGIFSSELTKKEVEILIAEKVKELDAKLSSENSMTHPETAEIRTDLEFIRDIAKKAESSKGEGAEEQIKILTEYRVFPSLKVLFLAHLFFCGVRGSKERGAIFDAVEETRRFLAPNLSSLQKVFDWALDRATCFNQVVKIGVAAIAIAALGSYLAFYSTHQIVAPYLLAKGVVPILSSPYCSLFVAKIVGCATTAITWVASHKLLQILFFIGSRQLCIQLSVLENKAPFRFASLLDRAASYLPLPWIISSFFAVLGTFVQRAGGPVGIELCKNGEQGKILARFRTFLDLADYMDQKRAIQ